MVEPETKVTACQPARCGPGSSKPPAAAAGAATRAHRVSRARAMSFMEERLTPGGRARVEGRRGREEGPLQARVGGPARREVALAAPALGAQRLPRRASLGPAPAPQVARQ